GEMLELRDASGHRLGQIEPAQPRGDLLRRLPRGGPERAILLPEPIRDAIPRPRLQAGGDRAVEDAHAGASSLRFDSIVSISSSKLFEKLATPSSMSSDVTRSMVIPC